MKKYLLFTILILAAFLAVSVKNCQDIRTDRNRLSDNQRTLLADIKFYRTKDSLNVASVERLVLTNREFRKYAGELEKTVEELNLKVKHLQSVSQSATETKYLVQTEIRDSIVVLPGKTDTKAILRTHSESGHDRPGDPSRSPSFLVYPLGHKSDPAGSYQ